ncbi:MAG: S24 family peptidase [Solibacillus isronensis]
MKKGEKLQDLIKEKYPHLSNRKFAELADIPPTTLQGIFSRGIDNAAIQIVKKIANALEMTVDDLDEKMNYPDLIIEGEHGTQIVEIKSTKPLQIYETASKTQSMKTMNYYGDVSAGLPITVEGIKNAEQIDLPKMLLGKYINRNDVFAVKVNGESMNKVIPNNSIAICIPVDSIDEVKNEDIVIFTKGNETSMKRFLTTNEAIIFSPESTLRCFFDVVVNKDTTDEIKVNAKVISYHAFLD